MLQRRSVAGETPRTRLASDRPSQSGSRDVEADKSTQIYQNIADSLTVPFLTARSPRAATLPPKRPMRRGIPRVEIGDEATHPVTPRGVQRRDLLGGLIHQYLGLAA